MKHFGKDAVEWLGVHDSHCCKRHGCKYGDPDCPVEFGDLEGIECESCHDEPDTQVEYESQIHAALNLCDPPRLDNPFPALIRVKGLVSHYNELVKQYTAREQRLDDYKSLTTKLLLSGRLDQHCIDLIKQVSDK